MKYLLSDLTKELEAAIHRLHCYVFDDEHWGFDDYMDLYGPLALLLLFFAVICLIGFMFG